MNRPTLRFGDKGAPVRVLQQRLRQLGYVVTVDGDFGSATRAAVVLFQASQGLDADGVVGPKTLAALDAPDAIDKPTPARIEPRWLIEARKELGLKELPGANSEPRIENIFTESGYPGYKDDTAWCAAFVNAMLKRAGIAGTGSLAARSFMNWGQPVSEPQPGDIAVFSRGTNPALGHVAFYLRTLTNSIEVLGGNQSDAVTVAKYASSRLLGYRRPKALPAPPDRAPEPSFADPPFAAPPDYEPPRATPAPSGLWGLILAILRLFGLAK